jgi:hypothetical protein
MSRNVKGFILSMILMAFIFVIIIGGLPKEIADVIMWGLGGYVVGRGCSIVVDKWILKDDE